MLKRYSESFEQLNIPFFKQQMLNWANQFNICCLLDNHQYQDRFNSYEYILAVGAITQFKYPFNKLLEVNNFIANNNDWLFGHVSYDYNQRVILSNNDSRNTFPNFFFFCPETIILVEADKIIIHSATDSPERIFEKIKNRVPKQEPQKFHSVIPSISKATYIKAVQTLQQHIYRGDCYEINFCQNFFANDCIIDPVALYQSLAAISPTPFGAFYKYNQHYLCCASPERFFKKVGDKIISQPIKGTMPRKLNNAEWDNEIKKALQLSPKDQTENVMIVDLVRNDLSKICQQASVKVEELFGIYSFPQVHQMISTIEGQLKDNIGFAEIIDALFPMGSMTGAPKKRVMELINSYEQTKRGIYSGTLGYISPEGNMDFNVVIRSIIYNDTTKHLNYLVGSAITANSNPEEEYEECILKATAMQAVLAS